MKKVKKIAGITLLVAFFVAGGFAIIAATMNNSSKRCQGLIVNIKNNENQYLLNEKDIENWVVNKGQTPINGKVIRNINLVKIENTVKRCGYLKSCQAYFDVKGNLIVDVEPYTPVARILNPNGEDKLIDKSGAIMPMTHKHSPTILLVSGTYFANPKNHKIEKNIDIMALINHINEDEFLNAQITQLDIDENKEVSLVPLFGDQKIEFGKPDRIDAKFEKLHHFYTKILPMSKWDDFKFVSLKYQSQIVCK